jgi:hypothetical protein
MHPIFLKCDQKLYQYKQVVFLAAEEIKKVIPGIYSEKIK